MTNHIKKEWDDWREKCLSKDAGPIQVQSMEAAFFSGAMAIHALIKSQNAQVDMWSLFTDVSYELKVYKDSIAQRVKAVQENENGKD